MRSPPSSLAWHPQKRLNNGVMVPQMRAGLGPIRGAYPTEAFCPGPGAPCAQVPSLSHDMNVCHPTSLPRAYGGRPPSPLGPGPGAGPGTARHLVTSC